MGWIIFRFVLIGPVVGSFVFAFVGGIHGFKTPDGAANIGDLVHETALTGLYGLVFAHLLAGLPAAASGAIYWLVLKRYALLNPRPLMRAFWGGIIGLACASVFRVALSVQDPGVSYVPAWSISGAVAGACCALCIGRELFTQSFLGRSTLRVQ
jgi:hypothetical protein